MKVYLFDTETGLYEGETFADAVTLAHEDGVTTIPPPGYGNGQVPIFDCRHNSWTIIPISAVRQRLSSRAAGTVEKAS